MAFSISGDKAVIRRLLALDRKVRNKIVRKAMRDGQKRTAAEARKQMPADKGTARKAIQVRAGKGRRGMIRVNVQLNTEKILAAARDRFFYPAILEYGSEALHRAAVRPMKVAYDLAGDEARRIAEREILAGIEREA